MKSIDRRNTARSIFEAAVQGVLPERLINSAVSLQDNKLHILGTTYSLEPGRKIHVFGSGKASAGMAAALLTILGERVAGGIVVTSQLKGEDLSPLQVIQGTHPVPDKKSVRAAELLTAGLASLDSSDFFIFLLSGGSSALIEKPVQDITLADMQETTRLLLHNSVPIQKINAVRKHLSLVKGGRLAQCTKASGVVLVISDVIDDDLSVIGSGPFYCDSSTYEQCRDILDQAAIWDKIPPTVRKVVDEGEKGNIPETPKEELKTVKHFLLGTNRVALEHARKRAMEMGLKPRILSSSLTGEAREVAKVLMAIARHISRYHEPFEPPVCLLFGGETTVRVQGKGRGGRNQELALAALAEIGGCDEILVLCGGTDGIDGNSSAAGAIADGGMFLAAEESGLSIPEYLADNDANGFFRAVGGLLETGPTGTNVMDITLIIIDREVV